MYLANSSFDCCTLKLEIKLLKFLTSFLLGFPTSRWNACLTYMTVHFFVWSTVFSLKCLMNIPPMRCDVFFYKWAEKVFVHLCVSSAAITRSVYDEAMPRQAMTLPPPSLLFFFAYLFCVCRSVHQWFVSFLKRFNPKQLDLHSHQQSSC